MDGVMRMRYVMGLRDFSLPHPGPPAPPPSAPRPAGLLYFFLLCFFSFSLYFFYFVSFFFFFFILFSITPPINPALASCATPSNRFAPPQSLAQIPDFPRRYRSPASPSASPGTPNAPDPQFPTPRRLYPRAPPQPHNRRRANRTLFVTIPDPADWPPIIFGLSLIIISSVT